MIRNCNVCEGGLKSYVHTYRDMQYDMHIIQV